MTTVVLHIGAMKTGTSYVQQVMSANREALRDQGVLWLGETWQDQVVATQQLLATGRDPQGPLDAWEALVDQVSTFDGRVAVLSMEFLSFASADVARLAVTSLAPHRVRVVLSLRDLARVLPAQWQELTQNRKSWTYQEYLDGVMAARFKRNACGRHFWQRQRWPSILRAWQAHVAADDLVVVTVAPPGAPERLLIERFGEAVGFDSGPLDLDVVGNDSLGAASAELMRRVTEEARALGLTRDQYKPLKVVLAKEVLSRRRMTEPAIVLPERCRAWAERTSSHLIEQVAEIAPRVVGDLTELLPTWGPSTARAVTDDPQQLSDDVLLDAALDGLAGLTAMG
jgi:hypothetical protein